MGGVWGHTALQPGGQSWEGGLVIMSRSQTLGISCWQVPTLRVLAALSPSTVRVDGLVAAPCHVGRAHRRSGLVPLSVGRSCSSDPKWPWRMRATTASCAGSRPGPGAGESARAGARMVAAPRMHGGDRQRFGPASLSHTGPVI